MKTKMAFFDVGTTLIDESKAFDHRMREAIVGAKSPTPDHSAFYRRSERPSGKRHFSPLILPLLLDVWWTV